MERQEFADLFERARGKGEFLVAYCSCAVAYSGRAEARLPRGDRVVIVKQDGVLLVHQPEGGNPINYLKKGAQLSLEKVEKHLVLKGRFRKEFLEVELFRVYEASARRLEDGRKQELAGNEADMSNMLRDRPELVGDFKPLSREEHTSVGFIDVFGHDGAGNLVVVECKRYTAGLSAVSQLHRYVEKIMALKGTRNVKGVMASPSISPNALAMLQGYGYRWAEVEPPKRHERARAEQRSLDAF